jgi:hypothetical protein
LFVAKDGHGAQRVVVAIKETTRLMAEIDQQSAQLWGLTATELEEIQRSLKELTE